MHPGRLTDDEGTGKIEADLYFDKRASIPRDDVATVLKVVTSDKFANQNFKFLVAIKKLKMRYKNMNNRYKMILAKAVELPFR